MSISGLPERLLGENDHLPPSRRNAMLVLSRRIGEEIVIDGNIRLTVIAVKGDRVRLGIAAPPSVTVDRKEVHDRRVGQTTGPLSELTPRSKRTVWR
jgi:carbon storage regulator